MFAIKRISSSIPINCEFYSISLSKHIKETIYKDFEGTSTLDGTYIISVIKVEKIESGDINEVGQAEFKVLFKALVIAPVNNMIVDCVTVEQNKMGLFSQIGPVNIFISSYQLKETESYGRGSHIRVKIVGHKVSDNKVYLIGTTKEEGLGVI